MAGAITIPGAEPGILAPYQERPQVHPVELRLHVDPAAIMAAVPVAMAVGTNLGGGNASAGATLSRMNPRLPRVMRRIGGYKNLLATSTTIEEPNKHWMRLSNGDCVD